MTKVELISKIQEKIQDDFIGSKSDFSQKNILRIIDTFFAITKESIAQGEHLELRGFGTFEAKLRKSKKAINPKTKEPVFVEGHFVPVFKPGKELKQVVKESIDLNKKIK